MATTINISAKNLKNVDEYKKLYPELRSRSAAMEKIFSMYFQKGADKEKSKEVVKHEDIGDRN